MNNYKPPLSVVFVWHPADNAECKPVVEHCFSLLSRDVSKPFSRSMNLPVFFRTTSKKGVPPKIDISSDKTIIFIFISKDVVADNSWVDYISGITKEGNANIIPVAVDKTAFNLGRIFDHKNYIRAYEYDKPSANDCIFIAVAHEIYRYTLNESFEKMALGKDNALKIFLSHAKDGKNGIKLAKALKDFIDNSAMRNFFDATDIAPGYKFDEEIIGHIKESTLIAIHSDAYSSRYWCQREILCAKEHNRPIIAVDALEEFEDRRFPFASNVPGVHVHIDGEPDRKVLLRILSSTLLETIRFFYSKLQLKQYGQAGWFGPDAEICSRPPEVSDIEKILISDGSSIKYKHKSIVYPEPPLYSEELSFLSKLGIRLNTPLTVDLCSMEGKNIGISISDLSEEELTGIGHGTNHMGQLSQDVARHLLAQGATLVYGGDIRNNGFTEFMLNEAQVLQTRLQSERIYVNNHIAWPIHKNNPQATIDWKSKYRQVANVIEEAPAADIRHLIPSEDTFLPPTNSQNLFVWSRCLTEMRNRMIESCDVCICAGGRYSGYKGRMPGVLEEIIIAIEKKRPIFIMGGFGGITSSVCKLIQDGSLPQELTLDWQIQNNPGYKDFLDFCTSQGGQEVDYASIENKLRSLDLNNGLSREDNVLLFNTQFVDEALHLVFKGLKVIVGK